MCRCRACDKPLTVAESTWYPDKGCHEDMCFYCKGQAGVGKVYDKDGNPALDMVDPEEPADVE